MANDAKNEAALDASVSKVRCAEISIGLSQEPIQSRTSFHFNARHTRHHH